MPHRVPLAAAVVLLAFLAVGCTAAPKPFRTHYGESAVTIADHITGCKHVAVGDIGNGAKSGMTSTATCTLDGRKIAIDSYKDEDSADAMPTVRATKIEQYWSEGIGWTAFETDDSEIQLQLTDNAEQLLKNGFADAHPTPDVDGEHAAAKTIAKSLHGAVEHYAP